MVSALVYPLKWLRAAHPNTAGAFLLVGRKKPDVLAIS
jgi:hypothetical protein